MKIDETNKNTALKEGTNEEKAETKEIQNEEQLDKKGQGANYSVNMAILGGLVGAGIGLLANPDTSKKLVQNVSESELVKIARREFKKTAQELLADQAQSSVKQLAMGYINKIENGMRSHANEKDSNGSTSNSGEENQSSKYEDIKEENKVLNERLEKIEKMLGQLVESK